MRHTTQCAIKQLCDSFHLFFYSQFVFPVDFCGRSCVRDFMRNRPFGDGERWKHQNDYSITRMCWDSMENRNVWRDMSSMNQLFRQSHRFSCYTFADDFIRINRWPNDGGEEGVVLVWVIEDNRNSSFNILHGHQTLDTHTLRHVNGVAPQTLYCLLSDTKSRVNVEWWKCVMYMCSDPTELESTNRFGSASQHIRTATAVQPGQRRKRWKNKVKSQHLLVSRIKWNLLMFIVFGRDFFSSSTAPS